MKTFSLDHPFPPGLSVREARDSYLAENGFGMDQYDADSVTVNFWGIRFPVPNPPTRKIAIRYHDLHHVMTGYGTDPTGEAEISVWEFRRGIRAFGVYVRFIIFTGIILGFFHSPKAVWTAWKASKIGNPLPKPTMAHYESLLEKTLGELRREYGVPEQGLAGPRKLNLDAPKRT